MANQRAIAAALGLTQATVSRALRDDPSIPLQTRQRVAKIAHQLGYRPNPLVSALMEHIRTGKNIHQQGCIAILVDAESESDWLFDETYRLQLNGIVKQAYLRGYQTECFFLRAKGTSAESIDRIIHSRGIKGVILAIPTKGDLSHFHFHFERYAIATISVDWEFLHLDRAYSDLDFNVSYAFNELVRRQYRRIGLCLPPCALNPRDSHWLAGYLTKQYYQAENERIPVLIGSAKTDPISKFAEWYQRWQPDALLCLQGEELAWLQKMGLSPQKDLGLVCLNRPFGSDFTGIEENNVLVGKITCDIVVNHITHNELGLPKHPRRLLVEGTWMEGTTLPERNPATPKRLS